MDTAIAQERLRKRFAKWDVDGSGTLERVDLENEAVRVVQAFGKSTAGAEAQQLTNAFRDMFEYLAREAGVSSDGSLTEEQFVASAGKLLDDGSHEAFNGVLGPMLQGIVSLCDKNADGQINADEFVAWMNGVGVDSSHAADAFRQIDANGNGELSLDELLAAVRDYHYGRLQVELLG